MNINMVSRNNIPILDDSAEYSKICSYCRSDLNMEEGVTIYDKNWYHNVCWDSLENPKEVIRND
jgi:hypothetical protein